MPTDRTKRIDGLMGLLDEYQRKGQFAECNEWIATHDPLEMELIDALCVLTITLKDKRLPARQTFYNKLYNHLLKIRPLDISGLLGGLDR